MTHNWIRRSIYCVGVTFILVGVAGMLRDLSTDAIFGWGSWVVGGAILHDVLIAPIVAVISMIVAKAAARWRPYLTAAVVMTALLGAVGWPFVLRLGRRATNLSALPRNYLLGYLELVGAMWLCVGLVAIVVEVRRRPRQGNYPRRITR